MLLALESSNGAMMPWNRKEQTVDMNILLTSFTAKPTLTRPWQEKALWFLTVMPPGVAHAK
jgi:hypothetical protein